MKSDPKKTVRVLLKRYGRTFSDELQIRQPNTPSGLFALLLAALLSSARIGHAIALKSTRILLDRGWKTPKKLAATTWQDRVDALDEGGYVRYDERTSTMLGQTAEAIEATYSGDLRKLREIAEEDPERERKLLKQFKGIGDVGVDIFFREVQAAWPELYPFADGRTLASARKLGLPANPKALAGLVRSRGDFTKLVAALVRVQLDRKHKEIQDEVKAASSERGADS